MKRIALLVVALIVALCSVSMLAGCGKGGSKIDQPATTASTNANGAVFAINLSDFSTNLNTAMGDVGSDIQKIESLDMWLEAQKASDDAGAYTVRATSLESSTAVPVFVVTAYDAGNAIREVKVVWDASSAMSQPDVLKDYCVTLIRAITGADAETAAAIYDAARAMPFTNGASKDLTYACFGSARCYYLVDNGSHIVTVEPYSDAAKAEEVAKGTFIYKDIAKGGEAEASDTVQATGDSNQDANANDAQADAAKADDAADAGGNA